ncbi:glycosyltransferase [Haladaptatus sp. DYSN1]|uniref:glycosyltransferase family 2 protein n=2 Tax=Haladaptatus TaxID=367188 RepID=UPI002406AAAB|nr:glycosyltransferase [Haladaptatus sp. DYSN1]
MPTVSVVIPTYNRSEEVTHAIDSVLAQTYDDFELLVVDDGSTDDTEEVVTSYDDDRVKFIEHEENQGAPAARNTGIEHAEGEYVAFLDSDDEWLPLKLERQVDYLRSKGDDWVAVYCDVDMKTKGKSGPFRSIAASILSKSDPDTPSEGGDELVEEVLADRLHTSAGSTLMVRTDVASEIEGFDTTFRRFQDPEFLMRVLRQGKLAHVAEPLVVRHESGDPPADVVREADEKYLEKFSDVVDDLESKGHDVRGSHNLVLAKLYLDEGNLTTGIQYLVRSNARPRHYPGVLWSAQNGVRENGQGRAVLAAGVGLVAFLAILFVVLGSSSETEN